MHRSDELQMPVTAPTICPRCVMDTTAESVIIDADGCNYCKAYDAEIAALPKFQPDAEHQLEALIDDIKARGRHARYDCLIGLSGGTDSSYVAYLTKKRFGLRPLAVHLDNGWNDELAMHNIEKIVRTLKLDLVTVVLNWREFSSIQKAFLKASTPDCEIPTDHAIVAILQQTARRFHIPTVIGGNNRVTEAIMPPEWSRGHSDWMYIRYVATRFGDRKPRTFPHISLLQHLFNQRWSSIRTVKLLSYIDFNKSQVEGVLKEKFDWSPYQSKHYESVYTRFFQGYLLPEKFGFDKRKAHLSNLVCAKQISRTAALEILSEPALDADEAEYLFEYVAEKFDLTQAELRQIVKLPPRRFEDYPSRYNNAAYRSARAVYRRTLKPVLRTLRGRP